MSDKELKPCKVCNSEIIEMDRGEDNLWFITCYECPSTGVSGYENRADAVEAWNTRPEPAEHGELVDKASSIAVKLRSLASQENCDGEPYDEMIEAAEVISQAIQALSCGGWISVEDRLPEESGVYPAISIKREDILGLPSKDWLGVFYGFEKDAGKGKCKWQHSSGFFDNGITHWLDLHAIPTPPTEKGG